MSIPGLKKHYYVCQQQDGFILHDIFIFSTFDSIYLKYLKYLQFIRKFDLSISKDM